MQKEKISYRNAVFLIVVMQIGSKVILGFHSGMLQDTWLSLLGTVLTVGPLVLLYARLMRLMPGRDIYEMAEAAMGKLAARVVGLLFGYYCLHLATLVLGNYAEFVHLTSLFQTPFEIIALLIFGACLYLAKSGTETLGKWCALVLAISIFAAVVYTALSAPEMRLENLTPMLTHSVGEIALGSLKLTPMPLGEAVVCLALLSGVRLEGKSPYRLWLVALGVSLFFLLEMFFRACTVLGADILDTFYFPTYKAASLIRIGAFLERIEAFLAFVYILMGIAKMSACLIAASRGAAKLFALPSHKTILLPMGFLSLAFSTILFHSIVDMFDFIEPYLMYALLFQVVIPLAIWITAEVRAKRGTLPAPPAGNAAKPPDSPDAPASAEGEPEPSAG